MAFIDQGTRIAIPGPAGAFTPQVTTPHGPGQGQYCTPGPASIIYLYPGEAGASMYLSVGPVTGLEHVLYGTTPGSFAGFPVTQGVVISKYVPQGWTLVYQTTAGQSLSAIAGVYYE